MAKRMAERKTKKKQNRHQYQRSANQRMYETACGGSGENDVMAATAWRRNMAAGMKIKQNQSWRQRQQQRKEKQTAA